VLEHSSNVSILEGIAAILRGAPAVHMRVHGETDNTLRADLARARATSCVDALVRIYMCVCVCTDVYRFA